MADPSLPTAVLSETLADAIAGRTVRAAVFTTFSFEPGFFELHVLPLLFTRPFSPVEKVRRVQLEDALRSINDLAVYYDRTALSQDGDPAQLDVRRIEVRRATGVFHPKLILVLVDDPVDDASGEESGPAPLSLVVGVLSANLTRSGWWENVETGHIEEIKSRDTDDSRWSFRRDLLGLIRRIRQCAPEGENHRALDRVRDFLLRDVSRERTHRHRASGRWHTRLFYGQDDLPKWIGELRLNRKEWNLEILSPYFDAQEPAALKALMEAIEPMETRVYLPTDPNGTATVSARLYKSVARIATWGVLPKGLLRPGARNAMECVAPRRVHAKVYRLWRGGAEARSVTLVGSVNLSRPGHSHAGAGNLEAAFLVDTSDDSQSRRWWLDPLDRNPTRFAEEDETGTARSDTVYIDLSLRFDWQKRELTYRSEQDRDTCVEVCDPSMGQILFTLQRVQSGKWRPCGAVASAEVGKLLEMTSFLLLKTAEGSWRVLVREENMAHRPSLLTELTPEEILMYWSLLSREQQAWFIEERLAGTATLEGIRVARREIGPSRETVFDRFSGVYHGFERLYRHVAQSISGGQDKEAEARLFGQKYDSLPVLLSKILEKEDRDPVINYVTFLCARQVCDRVRRDHEPFVKEHREDFRKLSDDVSAGIAQLRALLFFQDATDKEDFLAWYEDQFVRDAPVPEDLA